MRWGIFASTQGWFGVPVGSPGRHPGGSGEAGAFFAQRWAGSEPADAGVDGVLAL